jgi:predicted  nucleic acid-binding Zn-ribbon protein
MSSALTLYRLQQIDNRLKQVTARINLIQAQLDTNVELQEATSRLNSAQVTSHTLEQELIEAEKKTNSFRVKLNIAESNLYAGRIQNPKELQDLQKDITSIKKNMADCEDKQLDIMIRLEASALELENAKKNMDVTKGKVIAENSTLMAELITLQKDSENLNVQRQAVIPTIDETTLGQYENLRIKRSGFAVSQVIENACDACGSALTPAYAQSVHTSSRLVLCPMCGRILYSN